MKLPKKAGGPVEVTFSYWTSTKNSGVFLEFFIFDRKHTLTLATRDLTIAITNHNPLCLSLELKKFWFTPKYGVWRGGSQNI